jgi:hypothetical protein
MARVRNYTSATAFRTSLEERLRQISISEQIDVNRLRRQVAFDRLLGRLFRDETAPWVLKGGYALELRFKDARSTVDIDLTVQWVASSSGDDQNQIVRDMLQSAAALALGDWFEFRFGPAVMDLNAAPYGGARYSVEARMDERTFARFHLDAGIGDVVSPPLDTIVCLDWLGFAGIEPTPVRMISREQQFAGKLHAYTLPRNATNSRVKDLVDMALLIESRGMELRRVADALQLTFERRRTHELPASLVPPPADWQIPFRALADECRIASDIDAVYAVVHGFLIKVLTEKREP